MGFYEIRNQDGILSAGPNSGELIVEFVATNVYNKHAELRTSSDPNNWSNSTLVETYTREQLYITGANKFRRVYTGLPTGRKLHYRLYFVSEADNSHRDGLFQPTSGTYSITLPRPTLPPVLPPPPTPLNMEAGWNTLVWPGATVSVVTALMGRPITAVYEWIAADGTWLFYFPPGTPLFDEFNTLTKLQRGHTYQMYATEAFSW